MLNRGQYPVGAVLHVGFSDDGDCTISKVIGENSTGTGLRCEVTEVHSGSHQVGEKRTFKYGTNPLRSISQLFTAKIIVNTMPSDNKCGPVKQLSNALQRFLDADTKALFKAGLIGTDLELTSEGRAALRDITRVKYTAELVVRANEILAEQEDAE